MSIIPSGPPKKRGSSGSVYRPFTRRGMSSRALRTPTTKTIVEPQQELEIKLKDLSEESFEIPLDTPKARVYKDLVSLEKQLDLSISAQRKHLQRLFTMPANTLKGILRVHVYNTITRQPGDEIMTWNLRLQGRLFYPDFKALYHKDALPPGYLRKFSSFFKQIVFVFPTGDRLEWIKKQMPRETDGIDIMRKGNQEGIVRILLYLDNNPPRRKLSDQMATFLGAKEETQENVLQTIWEYINMNSLQDSEETRYVNNDARLLKLFGEERTDISTILSKVRSHMAEADPLEIQHKVTLSQVWTESEHIYDIEVDIEDPVLFEATNLLKSMESVIFAENSFTNKIPMLKVTKGMDVPASPIDEEINRLNQEVTQASQNLQTHLDRHQWLSAFLQNPAQTLEETAAEQRELAEVVSQSNYCDKINKENETDYKSFLPRRVGPTPI